MKDMSLETATCLGICVFFTIGGMLIVKFIFDKYKL
jgi:hypothetical protein